MQKSEKKYVHGYTSREARRLQDQASTLADLLHHDSIFPPGSRVLEAGCGVGAQTVIIARQNPTCQFTSVDISPASVEAAKDAVQDAGLTNVELQTADILRLPFGEESFDCIFLCFVLEHLPQPERVVKALLTVLKPGGILMAIEGDHGSTFFHPQSPAAWRTIQCQIDLQAAAGGDALIGRRLYPLFRAAGLKQVTVSPRLVYADSSRPSRVEGFTRDTYIAMIEGVKEPALKSGMISQVAWEEGMAALKAAAEPDGTFCYTFFKATGRK